MATAFGGGSGIACTIRLSVSFEQWPGCKPALPVIIPDDVIVAAGGGELPSFEDLADTTASCDGQASGTEGVVLHAIAIKEDIVADEKRLLEDGEGEARGVAVNVEGLDAVVDEVFFKGGVENERAADLVDRVVAVDVHFGGKEFPVKVGSAEEVVVGEENRVRPF
jgi:hypothetical protein